MTMSEWAIEEAAIANGLDVDVMRREIEVAMWAGDVDQLHELAPCRCCCWEHTFDWCPARAWNGCRGSGQMTRAERESWFEHYARFHGLTRDQFFG